MEDSFQLMDPDAVLQPLLQAAQESKDANISTVRSIVMKTLSDPDVFCGYDQIKAILQPALSQVAPEGEKLLQTLDLFSYGTYEDYTRENDKYLSLTDTQVLKLRQLTVLTTVQEACRLQKASVTYQEFQQALQMDRVEDVLVSCLYARVIAGQLCQKSASLLLSSRYGPTMRPRDVPLSQVPDMLQTLQKLQERLETSSIALTESQNVVQKDLQVHRQFLKQAGERKKKGAEGISGQVRGSYDDDIMADVGAGRSQARRQKRSRGGLSGMTDTAFGRFQV